MIAPLRPPSPLQRLSWLNEGAIKCRMEFRHPNGSTMFLVGASYNLLPQLVHVRWREFKVTALGNKELVEYTGMELGFVLTDEGQVQRWFREARLGRNVVISQITDHDFRLTDLIEHFEIPALETIAEQRAEEYANAREKILSLVRDLAA